jgi:hypothetical protein
MAEEKPEFQTLTLRLILPVPLHILKCLLLALLFLGRYHLYHGYLANTQVVRLR